MKIIHTTLAVSAIAFALGTAALMPAAAAPARAPDSAPPLNMLTQHNDNARTGANLRETILNTGNVNPKSFGKLFTRRVDGYLYAQPLYVQNLTFPGKGIHNVVYLATAHNSVYAFDADDPKAAAPLWTINLGIPVPAAEVYTTQWTDMTGNIGITSTPVIDPVTQTLYTVTKTKENGTYVQRFHALDMITGKERKGSPVVIKATVSGTGDASVNGKLAFDPVKQLQRVSLLLLNGVVYLGFGSHADAAPFHGWILGYDAKTLAQVCVFNATPNGSEGSFWESSMGLATDTAGNIYGVTGNGTFSASSGGKDYGNTILKMHPEGGTLKVLDYFTPYNQAALNENDTDLGSSGPLLVPGTNLLLTGAKNGWLYLVDRAKMGHYQAETNTQIVQTFSITPGNIHGSPVFWNSPKGPMVYVWPEFDYLKQFKFVGGKLDPTPVAKSDWRVPDGMPGGFLAISADSSKVGSGILWSSTPYDDNANWRTVPGVVRAYDAADVSHELWSTKMSADRDDVGMFAKFCPPTVINGKLYMSTFSNQLQVYGLLDAPAIDTLKAANAHLTVRYTKPVDAATATRSANYALDNGARILRASLDPDKKTVYLATTPLKSGVQYTLTAGGVRDGANPALMLPPATHAWVRRSGSVAESAHN